MRARIRTWLARAYRWVSPINPVPALQSENRALTQALSDQQARQAHQRDEAHRFLAEMVEAQAMCGAGPWQPGDVDAMASASVPLREALRINEAGPVGDISPIGAYGMYELLLQNVNWQREINYSSLEFTRWGIQQIILICRLYSLKNPIVRRLVDVCAQYVFARGLDATTNDKDANEVIGDFFKRNQKVVGRVALMELEKSKDRDGNLFFTLFTDPGTGEVDIRVVDATEIQDIWTDPEDADLPRYYRRVWTQRAHDAQTGIQATVTREAWYPALNFDPAECRTPEPKLMEIGGHPVMWESPVYHRKVGTVGKWLFGCPRIYPMLDWAKEARRFLEACASVRQSLSQYASTITTKGGQQAIEGIKQQIGTQVGPGAPILDSNPPAIAGSTFISGPGTVMEAFKVQGATFSPDDVRWYVIMCCMVKGLPPTFLGDMQTSNLATATSLDRPTETVFLSLQEEWTEDLVILLTYVLSRSLKAPGGKLRESCPNPGAITIREAARVRLPSGRWRYTEAKKKRSDDIEVRIDWPGIREGDIPALVSAGVEAMTLGNKGGQIVGVDEKEGIRWVANQLDMDNVDEMVEEQYPAKEYDPDRTKEIIAAPVPRLQPQPGGPQPAPNQVVTAQPGGRPAPLAVQQDTQAPTDASKKEAAAALRRLADTMEVHS
jgi:hypothetical protein